MILRDWLILDDDDLHACTWPALAECISLKLVYQETSLKLSDTPSVVVFLSMLQPALVANQLLLQLSCQYLYSDLTHCSSYTNASLSDSAHNSSDQTPATMLLSCC